MKKFLAFSISFSLFLNPHIITNGCAGEWEPDGDYHLLFSPEILKATTFEPFFLWYGDRFYPYKNFPADPSSDNLKEWMDYFNGKVNSGTLSKLIYKTTESQAQDYLDFYDGKPKKPGLNLNQTPDLKSNSVLIYVNMVQDRPFLEYLQFAVRCLPHVGGNEWDVPVRNVNAINQLILEGNQKYTASRNNFLKLRYGYQLTRLAQYSGDNKKCIFIYDNQVEPLPVKSIVKYWALSHKAGALKNSEKRGEAIYLFSQVFKYCLSRRIEAFTSFKFIYNEAGIAEALTFCKTPQDKNVLLFMEGLMHSEINLAPLQTIYSTESDSKELEILLAREIKKMEAIVSNAEYASGDINSLAPFTDFVVSCAKAGNTYRPYFWNFSAAYLYYLGNNMDEANKYLAIAKATLGTNDLFKDEIHVLEILLKVSSASTLDKNFETALLTDSEWLKDKKDYLNCDHVYPYLMDVLSRKFKTQNNLLYSELCKPGFMNYDLQAMPRLKIVDMLIEFQERPVKTDFEKYLSALFNYSAKDLHEIKGTIYLSQNQFSDAIKEFKIGKDPSLKADPFVIHTNDCHDCDFEDKTQHAPTKAGFAQAMIDLQKQTVQDPANAREYFLKLGNGYYNMTHFGNSWMAIDYYRQSYIDPKDSTEFYDCSKAKEYYLKALQASKNNKEFSAKCCFMISKCEQNDFYLTGKTSEDPVDEKFQTYFLMLKDKYSDTQYYDEVIQECGYFHYYERHH